MSRTRVVAVVMLALALLAGGTGIGDSRAADTPPSRRPTLPNGWTKLKGDYKVTPLQRQQAYKVSSDYGAKIAELKAKIEQLREQEREDLFKILTPAQREQLAKILTGSGTKTDPKPKESAKPKETGTPKSKTTDK